MLHVYHGTSNSVAQALHSDPAVVDVSRGGGELGQGFYAGENVSLAIQWARGRFSTDGAVLQIEVSLSAYAKLDIKALRWNEVKETWQRLTREGSKRIFKFGVG